MELCTFRKYLVHPVFWWGPCWSLFFLEFSELYFFSSFCVLWPSGFSNVYLWWFFFLIIRTFCLHILCSLFCKRNNKAFPIIIHSIITYFDVDCIAHCVIPTGRIICNKLKCCPMLHSAPIQIVKTLNEGNQGNKHIDI
jgi:hypothetical protein